MTFAAVQDGQSLKTLLLRSNPKNVWRSTKLRHYNTFGSDRLKMARESDFNWEDDLMTKWVIFYKVIVREFWRMFFSFSILLIALSIAKVIVWSHWQCNFLVIRLFDHQIGWSLLPILLSCTFVHRSYQRQESHLARLAKSHGANYGKPKPGSESEKRSIAYQVDY